jgi:hypothetical protein
MAGQEKCVEICLASAGSCGAESRYPSVVIRAAVTQPPQPAQSYPAQSPPAQQGPHLSILLLLRTILHFTPRSWFKATPPLRLPRPLQVRLPPRLPH